ncbi:MAG: phosphate-binding protein, partial [Gammaproteobacteria bacterium]
TYGFFKENALCEGDFKNTVNEQPGSASVVQGITRSISSIGYSGVGYRTSGVKAIPLAAGPGEEFYEATAENAINGKFPLARLLYVYVNKHPNRPLPPLEAAFIKMIMSKAGQMVVVKDGYIPLLASIAARQLGLAQ